MPKQTFKEGDRVRVVIEEADVLDGRDSDGDLYVLADGLHVSIYVNPESPNIVLEPLPPRPYKVGNKVRGSTGIVWQLGREGFMVIESPQGELVGIYSIYVGTLEESFPADSDAFELVE